MEDNNLNYNGERENIVSASIEANNNIKEEEATEVNNEIEIKKYNPIFLTVLVVSAILFAILVSLLTNVMIKKYINKDITTTTKYVNPTSPFTSYLKSNNYIKKFVSNNYVLILMNNDIHSCIFTIKGQNQTSNKCDYVINNDEIVLNNDNNEIKLKINETNLSYKNEELNIFDSEYKYYIDADKKNILLVDATIKNEYALFINGNNVTYTKYNETKESINLNNGMVFMKDGMNIIINSTTLSIGN